MVEKVRLASAGTGRWARVLANAIGRGTQVELVSCFSRDEAKRHAFQEEFGIARSAGSYEELLADPEVEGIVLATPNDTHRDLIVRALEAGKALYTEKPIAGTMEDGLAIGAAAESTGQVLAVGHSARRLGGSREMKRWLDKGLVGQVSLAEANFSNERGLELTADSWRATTKAPGGAMVQLGIHHADNLQYLLGPVASVSCHSRRVVSKANIPDAVMAICEFESGALGYIGTGWASPSVYSINLQGTKANLRYDLDFKHWTEGNFVDDYTVLHSQNHEESYGKTERTRVEVPRTDMYREQLEEFALAIRGEASVEVGPAEAIAALAVVHASIRSSERNGEAVQVAEVLETATATAR
ncbi:MAG TPA: Gfo/Idh/MocA family oxidoreductase [Nocardioidaceae bacterium]|nr:Gfo/Idh/MocA family oxidoreductase [Nocardioidaceae bacterium]